MVLRDGTVPGGGGGVAESVTAALIHTATGSHFVGRSCVMIRLFN